MAQPVGATLTWGSAKSGITDFVKNETVETIPQQTDGSLELQEHAVKSKSITFTMKCMHTDTLATLEQLVGTSNTFTIVLKDGLKANKATTIANSADCKAYLESVEINADGTAGTITLRPWSVNGTTIPYTESVAA